MPVRPAGLRHRERFRVDLSSTRCCPTTVRISDLRAVGRPASQMSPRRQVARRLFRTDIAVGSAVLLRCMPRRRLQAPARRSSASIAGGQALIRLERRRREASRPRRSWAQRHHALGMAHGRRHAIHHWHRQLISQRARQARQRRAGQDDHVGAVVASRSARRRPAARSRWSPCTLPMSASGSSSPRMLASRPNEAVVLHRLAVPGADARRDGDDREALAQQAGARQRGLGQASHRAGQRLAQAGQAGVAEGGDDHRVGARRGVRPPAAPRRRRRSAPRSASRYRPRRRVPSAPRAWCRARRCAAPRPRSAPRRWSEMLGLISSRCMQAVRGSDCHSGGCGAGPSSRSTSAANCSTRASA